MNNININVFVYEKQEPYSVYLSIEKSSDILNLQMERATQSKTYVQPKKTQRKKHFCMYCL